MSDRGRSVIEESDKLSKEEKLSIKNEARAEFLNLLCSLTDFSNSQSNKYLNWIKITNRTLLILSFLGVVLSGLNPWIPNIACFFVTMSCFVCWNAHKETEDSLTLKSINLTVKSIKEILEKV